MLLQLAVKLQISSVVAPIGFQRYVYGPVPPVTLTSIQPSLPPLQLTLVKVLVIIIGFG